MLPTTRPVQVTVPPHGNNSLPAVPMTPENFIESLDFNVRHKGADKFLNDIIERFCNHPHQLSSQKEQIEFFENVFNKLDLLNDQLQKPDNPNPVTIKEDFGTFVATVEANIIVHINNLHDHYKELTNSDQLIAQKISRLNYSHDAPSLFDANKGAGQ